jgi:hypothetical protein
MFKGQQSKIESGNLHSSINVEGNVIAKKLCKFGGVMGIFLSILAFLTASKKVPYFCIPFFIGASIMGGIFCAVFVTTVSQETAMYYKQKTCSVLAVENKKDGAQSGFMQAKLMNTHFINAMMCSATCPCVSSSKSLWAN